MSLTVFFRRTVSALYGIDVILRIIGDENEIDEVEQIISQLIEDCAKAVDNEQARLDKLMESNGIDEVPDYTDPITFNAKISSPQVGQFVGLVRKLDALMISMDTLWLSSVLLATSNVLMATTHGNSALSNWLDALLISKFEHENQPKLRVKKQKLSKRCLQPMTISLKRKQITPPTSQLGSHQPALEGHFISLSITIGNEFNKQYTMYIMPVHCIALLSWRSTVSCPKRDLSIRTSKKSSCCQKQQRKKNIALKRL